jgi:Raf kinase inhibitor-like YbhB/YbcL family protein
MAIQVTSTAFADKKPIPVRHTGDGEDISPAISWTAGPAGTVSYAIICDDPDAPTPQPWVHWVVYGIPAEFMGTGKAALPSGAIQGANSWGRIGYGGPKPPSDTHRYYFRVYALDTKPGLAPGATKEKLLAAMQGHILAQGVLMGTYTHR